MWDTLLTIAIAGLVSVGVTTILRRRLRAVGYLAGRTDEALVQILIFKSHVEGLDFGAKEHLQLCAQQFDAFLPRSLWPKWTDPKTGESEPWPDWDGIDRLALLLTPPPPKGDLDG